MKRSNEALKRGRAAASSSIEFVVRTFADKFRYRLVQLIHELQRPINAEFGVHLVYLKDPAKVLQSEMRRAAGKSYLVASKVFETLLSPSSLKLLEISPRGSSTAGDDAARAQEDQALADRAFSLSWLLVRNWLEATLHQSGCLPDIRALFLHLDPTVVRDCLQTTQR